MPATGRLLLFSLHQRAAPLHAREAAAAAVEALAPSRDHFALTSCHRVELYAVVPETVAPADWLAARVGPDVARLFVASVIDEEEAVARHVFGLACGLHSVVRGEGQILGQLRRSYDAARAAVPLDPTLSELVRRALAVGRAMRASTALGTVRRSIGSLAVDEALRLVADPERAVALVIGAGEMGKLSARALGHRVGEVVVANRDVERALELSRATGGRAVPLSEVASELRRADAVISAADTRGALLTPGLLADRLALGPLVVVDIAVPRSVGAEARSLPGLVYRSVDDLGASPDDLAESVAEAERRCAAEARSFAAWRREREAAVALKTLHAHGERVRAARLARALAKLRHLDERDRAIVASLARALTNELLHPPTVALRRSPDRAAIALELFGADES